MKDFKKEVDKYLTIENVLWIFLILLPFLLKDSVIKESIQTHYFDYIKPIPFLVLIGVIIILWYIKSNLKTKMFIFKWFFPVCLWINLYMPKEGNGTFVIIFIDILFCVLILWTTFDILKHDSYKSELNQGLISDDPIESDEENDSFGRRDYAKSIVSEIRKTVNKRAFNIAVTGAWGSGKTSFLNLIKGEMDKEVDNEKIKFITVNYNPWDFKEDKIIGLDLLKTISNELAKEIELQEKFKGLMVSLQGVDESPWYKVIPNLLIGFSTEKSINEYREEIGKALQDQNKKLVIFLDDLDRLDGDEILEVFKTIRNSFDIANTFFILGFDIAYVADQIREKVKGNGESDRALEYLDKIFQMRLFMPSNVDFDYVRLLEKQTGQLLDVRIPKLFDEMFKKLNARSIFSIVNGIKVFEQSTEGNQDFDFSAKVLLQIISINDPKLYNYLSENYSEVMNDTVKQEIFKGQTKPSVYYPQGLEKIKIADLDNEKKKLILYLLYLMTPYNSINLSESIYYSYFKFKTPDHLISRTGLNLAIGNCDQNFIDKHIGTIKEADLFGNMEISAKDYKKLDHDQVDFILRNLINYHAELLNSVPTLGRLLKTNIFDFPHSTIIGDSDIYKKKSFTDYINSFDPKTRVILRAKFWYLEEDSIPKLENAFQEYLNENNQECGYIFKLLQLHIWPKHLELRYPPEKIDEINTFKQNIKDKLQEAFSKNPIHFIKPFVLGLRDGYFYHALLDSAEFLREKLDRSNEKHQELYNWLSSGPFLDINNHYIPYPLDYPLVFGEEYDN